MKLVVPCLGSLNSTDARLVRLGEFLGCKYELLPLEKGSAPSLDFIKKHVGDEDSCFVVNPAVIRECLSSESFPQDLASSLTSQFPFVLIHNLSLDPFTASTMNTLSAGRLPSVHAIDRPGLRYDVASGHDRVCGAFSGLTFGPVDVANDRFIAERPGSGTVRTYIAIGGRPFFAGVQRERAEVLILANAKVAGLDEKVASKGLTGFFSHLIPASMLLRYVFGEECWHPNQHHATFIIDDPLLRKNYGFLNYAQLLRLMDEYDFHTSIAFIPHNYLRNSTGITRMFRQRPDRFSICFHGNDHTAAEFATKDSGLLNSMLTEAEERMRVFQTKTGIHYDDVMVFPQGHFSVDAMKVLKARNFSAAVNSGPYPLGEHMGLTLADMLEPAILKYGGLPLFLREYVGEMTSQDVAFNLFFGKPVLIMEHHDFFKDPKCLPQLVSRINALAPEICWSNLRTTVQNSYLMRRAPDGALQIRVYSNVVNIKNDSPNPLVCHVNWPGSAESTVQKVLVDGIPGPDERANGASVSLLCELPPHSSKTFLLVQQNDFGSSDEHHTLPWRVKAFLRRRLSEIRDNYLSKSRPLSSVAKLLKRHLLNN